ncbi:MAG: RnfABCDGE type electron transport complex subunit G [Lachnospiraceae bacterium]
MKSDKLVLIKDAITLFLITLVAGILLGGVYQITKDRIAEQQRLAEEASYQTVFPAATSFDTQPTELVDTANTAQSVSDEFGSVTIDGYILASNNEGNLGYVVKVTSHEGYGGDISLSIGVDMDGVVTGVEILSISETAGLGMNAQKESFRQQYVGKQVDSFTVTKTGSTSDSEIDALSAATITSNAFTNAVNAALDFFNHYIAE